MVTQFFRETSRPQWRRAGREAIIYCVNNPHGLLFSHQPLTASYADAVVDRVFPGLLDR